MGSEMCIRDSTKEHDLQLFTRRAKVQELNYGDVNFHKDVALKYMEGQLT